ncbi:MAG: hypothetical protein QW728_00335, partial [Thermoplasmata archaeon]
MSIKVISLVGSKSFITYSSLSVRRFEADIRVTQYSTDSISVAVFGRDLFERKPAAAGLFAEFSYYNTAGTLVQFTRSAIFDTYGVAYFDIPLAGRNLTSCSYLDVVGYINGSGWSSRFTSYIRLPTTSASSGFRVENVPLYLTSGLNNFILDVYNGSQKLINQLVYYYIVAPTGILAVGQFMTDSQGKASFPVDIPNAPPSSPTDVRIYFRTWLGDWTTYMGNLTVNQEVVDYSSAWVLRVEHGITSLPSNSSNFIIPIMPSIYHRYSPGELVTRRFYFMSDNMPSDPDSVYAWIWYPDNQYGISPNITRISTGFYEVSFLASSDMYQDNGGTIDLRVACVKNGTVTQGYLYVIGYNFSMESGSSVSAKVYPIAFSTPDIRPGTTISMMIEVRDNGILTNPSTSKLRLFSSTTRYTAGGNPWACKNFTYVQDLALNYMGPGRYSSTFQVPAGLTTGTSYCVYFESNFCKSDGYSSWWKSAESKYEFSCRMYEVFLNYSQKDITASQATFRLWAVDKAGNPVPSAILLLNTSFLSKGRWTSSDFTTLTNSSGGAEIFLTYSQVEKLFVCGIIERVGVRQHFSFTLYPVESLYDPVYDYGFRVRSNLSNTKEVIESGRTYNLNFISYFDAKAMTGCAVEYAVSTLSELIVTGNTTSGSDGSFAITFALPKNVVPLPEGVEGLPSSAVVLMMISTPYLEYDYERNEYRPYKYIEYYPIRAFENSTFPDVQILGGVGIWDNECSLSALRFFPASNATIVCNHTDQTPYATFISLSACRTGSLFSSPVIKNWAIVSGPVDYYAGTGGVSLSAAITIPSIMPVGTELYVQAVMEDTSGTGKRLEYYILDTVKPPAPPAQILSYSVSVTNTSATISWTTDTNSTGQIEYGSAFQFKAYSNTSGRNHTVLLTGLSQSTSYPFRIVAFNSVGIETATDPYSFQTLSDAQARVPVISEVNFNVMNTYILVSWVTDVDAVGWARWESGTNNTTSPEESTASLQHSINLTGLNPSTTYTIYLYSRSIYGIVSSSTPYTITTKTDEEARIPAAQSIQVVNITDSSVIIVATMNGNSTGNLSWAGGGRQ